MADLSIFRCFDQALFRIIDQAIQGRVTRPRYRFSVVLASRARSLAFR